jgi:hypothetical protein
LSEERSTKTNVKGQEGATDEASCTRVVAGVQAISHPSESKQRMHVKRLGYGHLPAIHHALFAPAARLPSRMVCFTRTKWDGERTKRDTVAAA